MLFAFAGLDRQAPDAVVSLMVHNSTEVAQLVESGEADIGFLESPTVRRSLRRRRIGWDRLVVAVAPGHEWANRRRALRPADLATGRLLVREVGSGTRETLESALGALRVHDDGLHPALECAEARHIAHAAASRSSRRNRAAFLTSCCRTENLGILASHSSSVERAPARLPTSA